MARRILIENTLSGKFKDVLNIIFEIMFGKTEQDLLNFELDFRDTTHKFYKTYTQTGIINFTKHDKNSVNEISHIKYVKITANAGAINFSADFVEARNDYEGDVGDYDVWFVYLPDGKVQYNVIAR